MSGGCCKLSSEITIVGAENVEKRKGSGCVFVRMYISAGDGNGNGRVQLSTRELPLSSSANDSFRWDQSFSLECNGTEDSVNQLKRGSVALELRWRPTPSKSFAGWGQPSSKLLGRAELPWGPAFSSPGSQIEAWVPLIASGSNNPPAPSSKFHPSTGLLVAMTVSEVGSGRRQRRRSGCEEERCGCSRDECGNTCQHNYQLFALAAALEAF